MPTEPDVTAAGGTPELADRLDRLAGAYAFTSRLLLASPDADLLARIREPGLMTAWPMTDPTSVQGAGLLVRGADEELLTLARDYQRLFIGPGRVLAPPYESVHLTRDRLVFDEQTRQVRAAYRQFGRVAPALHKEPDDHLGLELDFLSHLCVRALDALDAGEEDVVDATLAAQQSFLTDHVLAFAETFTDQVAEHARTDFYRGVGLLVAGLLAGARDTFAE